MAHVRTEDDNRVANSSTLLDEISQNRVIQAVQMHLNSSRTRIGTNKM